MSFPRRVMDCHKAFIYMGGPVVTGFQADHGLRLSASVLA